MTRNWKEPWDRPRQCKLSERQGHSFEFRMSLCFPQKLIAIFPTIECSFFPIFFPHPYHLVQDSYELLPVIICVCWECQSRGDFSLVSMHPKHSHNRPEERLMHTVTDGLRNHRQGVQLNGLPAALFFTTCHRKYRGAEDLRTNKGVIKFRDYDVMISQDGPYYPLIPPLTLHPSHDVTP